MSALPADAFRQMAEACVASVRRTFLDHVPLYACLVAFAAITQVILVAYHLDLPLISGSFFLSTLVQVIVLLAAGAALRFLFASYSAGRSSHPLREILRHLFSAAMHRDRLGSVVHGVAVLAPLLMIFTALKIDIIRIHPFSWDPVFMRMSLALGNGHTIWEYLQPIVGYPFITTILSFAYDLWFFAMFGCVFWQLARPSSDLVRSQFFLAFVFAWFFGGFVLATIFSSAGPCFYDYIAKGPNPYAPLMHYLRATSVHWPIWTVAVQDELWRAYVTGQGDIQGISAMPSMHVTVAVLLALLGWRTNWKLGTAFSVFAVLIFVGSIVLGWHYVFDGVAGALVAMLVWIAAGRITATWTAFLKRQRDAAPSVAEPVSI